MAKPRRRLTRADVLRALTRLGELCAERRAKVELAIYGGTVMMFVYDCRAATKDIDAIFHPPEIVEPLIAQVAAEQGLPCRRRSLVRRRRRPRARRRVGREDPPSNQGVRAVHPT